MSETYTEVDDAAVRGYRRVHANGEQTRVIIMSVGERDYVAVAYDINPADFSEIAGDVIAYDPTLEGVNERAERWMQQHPKGVMQALGGGEGNGGGTLSKITAMAGKLNDYGNDLRENAQEVEQGKQIVNEDNNK